MSLTLISIQSLVSCHLLEWTFFRNPELWVLLFSLLRQRSQQLPQKEGGIYGGSAYEGIWVGFLRAGAWGFTARQIGRRRDEFWGIAVFLLPLSYSIWNSLVHRMMSAIFRRGLPSSIKPLCKHLPRDARSCASLVILNPVKLTAKITHDNSFIRVTISHSARLAFSQPSSHWNVGIIKSKNT